MFRTKEEREEYFRSSGGRMSKSNWFRDDKKKTTTTTTIPTTPGGLLAKQMQTTHEYCPTTGRCRTEVLEGGGVTVKQTLSGTTPSQDSCGRQTIYWIRPVTRAVEREMFQVGDGYSSRSIRCRRLESRMKEGHQMELLATSTLERLPWQSTHNQSSTWPTISLT